MDELTPSPSAASPASTAAAINKIHHQATAKFHKALEESTNLHLQSLQQTPQVNSSTTQQVLKKQKEAFQHLLPSPTSSSSSSKLAPAETALVQNDPFHADNLRVPYDVAFQTSMTSSSSSSLPSSPDNSVAKTDMSLVTSIRPRRSTGEEVVLVAAAANEEDDVFERGSSSSSPEFSRAEFRTLQNKLERLAISMETMQATMQQLFYDFLFYLMIGILIVFTLDQYTSHQRLIFSSSSSMMDGAAGGMLAGAGYAR